MKVYIYNEVRVRWIFREWVFGMGLFNGQKSHSISVSFVLQIELML